jgi:hypothetical protein
MTRTGLGNELPAHAPAVLDNTRNVPLTIDDVTAVPDGNLYFSPL